MEKQRESHEYQRFFPGGLSWLRGLSLDELLEHVARMQTWLLDGHGPDPAAWAPRLSGQLTTAESARATHKKGTEAHKAVRFLEVEAREQWINAYRTTYGQLTARFPDDRERVESFYYRPEADKPEEAEVSAPAGEAKPAA